MTTLLNQHHHFIGIGGSGMSGLAKLLLQMGIRVSGSDISESLTTDYLQTLGATIMTGHHKDNSHDADCIVVSSAIDSQNPELVAAKEQQKPCLLRAELLNQLMENYRHRISVAGTHGKTSTTAFIATLLNDASLSPTYLTGAPIKTTGSNANLGTSEYFVTESDESDGSFLKLCPSISIVTNIEPEHMNFFGDKTTLLSYFKEFLQHTIERNGYIIMNKDDPLSNDILEPDWEQRTLFFSITRNSNIRATDIEHHPDGVSFKLWVNQVELDRIFLRVYGVHNVYNALATIALGINENLPIKAISRAIQKFKGTQRRFEKFTEIGGVQLYDDYAHHPTEINVTLQGAKESLNAPITCIFQPHRYSRTKELLHSFPNSFDYADTIIITDIYAAHEPKNNAISANTIVDMLKEKGKNAYFIPDKDAIPTFIQGHIKHHSNVIITMGAGDISAILPKIAQELKKSPHKLDPPSS